MVDRTLEEQLEIADIQGDVLIGLQKDAELFVCFEIVDVDRFKRFLGGLRLTSCLDVMLADAQIAAMRSHGGQGRLDIRGTNIGFTREGLAVLGAPELDAIRDAAFVEGLAGRSRDLFDPPSGPGAVENWHVGGGTRPLHGIILLTGKDLDTVHAMFDDLERMAGAETWHPYFKGEGATRQGDRGHEHFGFLDGVSQPAIRGRVNAAMPNRDFLNPGLNPANPDQGLPGADLHWPGAFVFGYAEQNASDSNIAGPLKSSGAEWMRNGSFMVYRRLEQLVPEFDAKIAEEAAKTSIGVATLGARMVGRFKSGWPVMKGADDLARAGDPMVNNDFEFGNDDPEGVVCPFAAHIRKTYPRNDDTPGGGEADTQTHRIFRAGIPFGSEVTAEESKSGTSTGSRGLMFVCYQTSITDQFEFIMQNWVNNADFAKRDIGADPILGQTDGADRTRVVRGLDPGNDPITFGADFIRPTGGGYFFVPSISSIAAILSK